MLLWPVCLITSNTSQNFHLLHFLWNSLSILVSALLHLLVHEIVCMPKLKINRFIAFKRCILPMKVAVCSQLPVVLSVLLLCTILRSWLRSWLCSCSCILHLADAKMISYCSTSCVQLCPILEQIVLLIRIFSSNPLVRFTESVWICLRKWPNDTFINRTDVITP